MKNLFYSLVIATSMMTTFVHATPPKQPETKRVCVMQKDTKTGKEKEVCRTIKIHKKLEGTPVPVKK